MLMGVIFDVVGQLLRSYKVGLTHSILWSLLFLCCLWVLSMYRCRVLSWYDVLSSVLIVVIFDVWGINFRGPFSASIGFMHILVATAYMTK